MISNPKQNFVQRLMGKNPITSLIGKKKVNMAPLTKEQLDRLPNAASNYKDYPDNKS